jgi:DNA-binding winged helix-turn-helix (wHTH) protein
MVFRFGEFEVNQVTREIFRGGELVSVEPKVFDLLCLLVRLRSRVLP